MQIFNFLSFIPILFYFTSVSAVIPAQSQCERITNRYALPQSYYANDGCLLHCEFSNFWRNFQFTYGEPCPFNGAGLCYRGECVGGGPDPQHGKIDVSIIRGEFAAPGSLYVSSCIRNSSEIHSNPIDPPLCSKGTICTTTNVFSSSPNWNRTCPTANNLVPESRIYFDIIDYRDNSENSTFWFGTSFLVQEVLERGDNGREIYVNMPHRQTLWVRINYESNGNKKKKVIKSGNGAGFYSEAN